MASKTLTIERKNGDIYSYIRKKWLRLVKWSTTVQSINKEELDGFEIPLPPPEEQKQIVQLVKARRAEIAREQEAAERLSKEITADIEALILGSKTLTEQ